MNKKSIPDIQRWYNHGMGTESIKDRLINEYSFTDLGATILIEKVIYS